MKKLTAILSFFILIVAFSYLGWRTIEHEILMRQTNQKLLAQSQMKNIKSSIESLLNQRAVYFNSLAQFLHSDQTDIDVFLASQTDIKNIFKIKHNKIVYFSNKTDLQWSNIVESIEYDSSILVNHHSQSEQFQPKFGWYQFYDHLIYWVIESDTIIGFELSTINFSLNVICLFDDQMLADNFVLLDHDKQIYVNGEQLADSITITLDYPLQNWKLIYYYQSPKLLVLYLLGGGVIGLFIIAISFIVLYCYREYTRTLRLAKQQVSFVGQVSHEFKTPLTNITLYAELLQEKLIDEPVPISDYLEVITSESKRLTRLVQNVLNFNKPAKLNIKPVNLTHLVERVYTTFKPVLAKKSLQLNLIINCDKNCMINTDEDSVLQIVNNFLSNAEKYAARGKKVDLLLNKNDKQTIITVRDYGIGIPNHLIRQIFKPFYRINSSITEGVAGTGIGLTIANQLAQQLNGTIQVVNENPGVAFSLIIME
ncbi:HAMP domain-containing histidine kinase [Gilliamella sp. ESL0232]|uniref:sensor histidine kinase n=2 Tax=Gilliamella TaxID=1193503 RepID=UPI0015803DA7|nr:HAMP domain-containing sensor histidine kinase [Gilliamella sp. ESL0232]NUE95570.1 HAMP domain-containing histidine kinase [Gilliamella sp. ESL0232]